MRIIKRCVRNGLTEFDVGCSIVHCHAGIHGFSPGANMVAFCVTFLVSLLCLFQRIYFCAFLLAPVAQVMYLCTGHLEGCYSSCYWRVTRCELDYNFCVMGDPRALQVVSVFMFCYYWMCTR